MNSYFKFQYSNIMPQYIIYDINNDYTINNEFKKYNYKNTNCYLKTPNVYLLFNNNSVDFNEKVKNKNIINDKEYDNTQINKYINILKD